MTLNDQIAVITGGASGMGQACARLLSESGVKVVVWDKSVDTNPVLSSMLVNNQCMMALACNVSSEEEVLQAMHNTVTTIGVPRICINCAGIAPARRMIGKDGLMPLAAFKQVIDTNLIGTFNVMRIIADAMTHLELKTSSNERGVIINTASVAAFEGQIGQSAYSASKGGIVAMTLPLARELAFFAIRVNTIAPGVMATPMLLNMPQEVQDNLTKAVTFPKRLGKPEEFAALVKHIIENEYINGEIIRLDGALRMQAR